jgi:hypothetical protein
MGWLLLTVNIIGNSLVVTYFKVLTLAFLLRGKCRKFTATPTYLESRNKIRDHNHEIQRPSDIVYRHLSVATRSFSRELTTIRKARNIKASTVKVRLSGTLGEWGVPIDRFCRQRER